MTEGERRYQIEERQRLQEQVARQDTRAALAERQVRDLVADRDLWKWRAKAAEAQLAALGIAWELKAS